MKIGSEFKILFFVLLLGLVFVNFKIVKSSSYQAYLLYDYNSDEYNVDYEQIRDNLDASFPNISHT